PASGRERSEQDHDGEQGDDEDGLVLVEDEGDHVADRRQLDERANDGDGDVALEVRLPPDRDGNRHGDQRKGAGELAEADVRGAVRGGRRHAGRSSCAAPAPTSLPASSWTT